MLGLALWGFGYRAILLGLGALGIGMGFIIPAMKVGVLTSSPIAVSSLPSGILNSARQKGGALGAALMGALVQTHQERGMLWSCVVTMVGYLLMAGVTLRSIQMDSDGR